VAAQFISGGWSPAAGDDDEQIALARPYRCGIKAELFEPEAPIGLLVSLAQSIQVSSSPAPITMKMLQTLLTTLLLAVLQG